MNVNSKYQSTSVLTNALVTIVIAILIGLFVLNPIWEKYSPPFPMERVFPAITAPVDGPFYLQNADQGYQWDSNAILSIWFHPLLSIIISLLPNWLSSKIWFWLISLLFAFGAILLVKRTNQIYGFQVSSKFLPLLLLIPGGMSIATGNPEIPTLFFTSALLISVLCWQKWYLTLSFSVLAVLTKPNALYMVPILFVYLIVSIWKKEKNTWKHALIGILGILLGWVLWIVIVDLNVGEFGSYWQARRISGIFVAGNPINFFVQLANSYIYTFDTRDQIRYTTCLLIPLANIYLIGRLPFSKESHRYALAIGNLAMMVIALMYGNPNKIIVYSITIPGNFSIYLMFFQSILNQNWRSNLINKYVVIPVFIVYCLFMLYVYILGTPLGWYY